MLPQLSSRRPGVKFYIVGMRPAPSVHRLTGAAVTVTGTVPDVRPYLKHAAVVVAPLRVARGVQNKVLEAMSMARPVVVSTACANGIDATADRDYAAASDADAFVASIGRLLDEPARAAAMGAAARSRVLARYSWKAHLSRIDAYLEPSAPGHANAA